MADSLPNRENRDNIMPRGYRRSAFISAAAITASWITAALGPFSYLMPIIIGVTLFVLLRRRHFVLAALIVGLMPVTIVFLLGLVDYARGEARLVYTGLPGTEFYNADRELRCQRASSGCIAMENEWVFQSPHNLAVELMIRAMGPVRGSYLGPYPTHEEASAALAAGGTIAIDELRADRVTLSGKTINLDEGVGRKLVNELCERWVVFSDQRLGPIAVAEFQKECLILRIPTPAFTDDGALSAVIVLISRSAGRPFAYYSEGSYDHRIPPVPWKRSANS